MTNKPMLSVERELLSRICDDFEAGQHSKACEGASKLRAILDDKYRAPPIKIYCHANNIQIIRNEDGSCTIRNKEHPAQAPKITGRVYSFSADETAPAEKPQVAQPGATHFEKSDKCPSTGWIQYYRHDGCCRWSYWPEGLGHWSSLACKPDGDVKSLYAEHHAPAADHTQCEECKGWGYHENHNEGGGTECGECGGSGNATVAVAVVMPDRMKVEPFTTIDRGSKNYKAGYNAAIAEVAKLNGLKT